MKILVLGASGMIGSAMYRVLSEKTGLSVLGTLRSDVDRRFFAGALADNLIAGVEMAQEDTLLEVFSRVRPEVVVNCIGLTKHRSEAGDPLQALTLNALLPHRLANLCSVAQARLIHVSTDCVFSGIKGGYAEGDTSDALDFYGKSKYLGEVSTYPHAITLRTSTIGHELHTQFGLLEWFLAQQGSCKGFSQAIFSGMPSVVFAQIVRDVVIPRPTLSGLYHVAAQPINKFELLKLIARIYKKDIDIIPDRDLVIDRSLSGARFAEATGYIAPGWENMINHMHAYAH